MRKKIALLLALLMTAAVLSGCQQETNVYPEAGKTTPRVIQQGDALATPTPTPTVVPADFYDTDAGYDPLAEEDDSLTGSYALGVFNEMGDSVYAGTTPIPLDPIDMPTPTPRPDLVFNYAEYTASKLGLSFEAPNDWTVTTDDGTTYTLTDPNTRDGVNAFISITVSTVGGTYKLTDVKNDLKSQLAEIQKNYPTWSVAVAAGRTLMGEDGYYNTYRGEEFDGTVVRGLVHIVLLSGRTVTIHLQAPGWFNTSYTKVYSKMRNTLKGI